MQTFLDLLLIAAKFLVGLWPLMFLALLVGIRKRESGFGTSLRSSIKGLIIAWGSFGILRVCFSLMKVETLEQEEFEKIVGKPKAVFVIKK